MSGAGKRCSFCGKLKGPAEFYLDSRYKSGLSSRCRECVKTNNAKYNNAQSRKRATERWRERKRRLVDRYKMLKGCEACGYKRSACALDLHHIDPSKKVESISRMMKVASMESLKKEIRKCVVLCANCHRGFHAGLVSITRDGKVLKYNGENKYEGDEQ